MRFYGYFRSSASYRVRIAFNLKRVPYDFTSIHLRKDGGQQKKPDYRAHNPQGLVPLLEDGDFRLSQSLAIVEWLDETYPQPPLLPGEINARAEVRAFSQIIACDIHPLQNLRVLEYLKQEYGRDQSELDRWCQHWIGEGLAACEGLLERRPVSQFAFGDAPSLADICLVPQVFSAERFGVDLSKMPRVTAIAGNCNALPAFADAHPSRQPDAE
jgi:maleylacetoacetate isomerase